MTAKVKKPVYIKKHKMGRKSKLTRAVLNRLACVIGEGYTDQTLADIANVSKNTFINWKAKSKNAKSGFYLDFRYLYEAIQAEEQKLVVRSLIGKVRDGDLKAIELAMKRHPRLRAEFKETPQEIEQAGAFEFKVEFVPVRSAGPTTSSESDDLLLEKRDADLDLEADDPNLLLETEASETIDDDSEADKAAD